MALSRKRSLMADSQKISTNDKYTPRTKYCDIAIVFCKSCNKRLRVTLEWNSKVVWCRRCFKYERERAKWLT